MSVISLRKSPHGYSNGSEKSQLSQSREFPGKIVYMAVIELSPVISPLAGIVTPLADSRTHHSDHRDKCAEHPSMRTKFLQGKFSAFLHRSHATPISSSWLLTDADVTVRVPAERPPQI
ncbi:hypothetical protein WMY93_029897 [Mugilogobius chulae]|uniref:Uncharacterized protein n=1 Tax=Mugilogobius chulae TaxID=88201 RepID=A0AAW0MY86_9GOBI